MADSSYGPARYFVDHPVIYVLSLVAAGGTAVHAATRASRTAFGWRRIAYMALAANCAAQCAGMAVTTEAVRRGRIGADGGVTTPARAEP
jgi:hypothetical protein